MKILRKWFLKWIQKAKEESDDSNRPDEPSRYPVPANSIGYGLSAAKEEAPARLNFNVMPASGGVVISINNYDRKNGRHTENLHVIHDDEDIATNIGHIVSMELLRSQ